jgi:hypothetical protein
MLFTFLSLGLFMTPVQETVLAQDNPSISGTVQDDKGHSVPGATVFIWKTAPRNGTVKSYL